MFMGFRGTENAIDETIPWKYPRPFIKDLHRWGKCVSINKDR